MFQPQQIDLCINGLVKVIRFLSEHDRAPVTSSGLHGVLTSTPLMSSGLDIYRTSNCELRASHKRPNSVNLQVVVVSE